MPYPQTLEVFASLQPGDRVQVDHEVKVGFRKWHTATVGTVVRKDRVRQGVAFQRNFDDKAFCDVLVLKRDSGELTTVTLDEFSEVRKL
jgi:hypothetical protein